MQRVAALILAAGGSSRFGSPKQLVEFHGKSFVRRIIDSARDAGCSPIVLVVGSDADEVSADLAPAVIVVENKNWPEGIGTSIRTGIQRLVEFDAVTDAVLVLVCDQPFADAKLLKALIAHAKQTGKEIVASSYAGTLGVPALFARSLFTELLSLDGDIGAKKIIMANTPRVTEFSFPEGKIDVDSPADYAAAMRGDQKIGV